MFSHPLASRALSVPGTLDRDVLSPAPLYLGSDIGKVSFSLFKNLSN